MIKKLTIAKLQILAILFVTTVLFVQCKHDSVDVEKQAQVCFQTQVLPVFQSNCVMCHSAAGEQFPLDSYGSIIKEVKAGDPLNSEVYQAITNVWGGFMPPSPKDPIPIESRTIIFLWIKQGAKQTCN